MPFTALRICAYESFITSQAVLKRSHGKGLVIPETCGLFKQCFPGMLMHFVIDMRNAAGTMTKTRILYIGGHKVPFRRIEPGYLQCSGFNVFLLQRFARLPQRGAYTQ